MRTAALSVRLPISLVLAVCAGWSIALAQQPQVCTEAVGCLQQAPLLASAPRTTRDSPVYGPARSHANPIEKPVGLASQDNDQSAVDFSSGDKSWQRWPSLTDF